MKLLKSMLLAGGALMIGAAAAQAADLPTKKEAAPPPPKVNCFESFWTYMNTSAADCPLSAAGFTFYGMVDMGVGYSSNASRLNNWSPSGVSELISATSHGSAFQFVPNGLSQSNAGLKWKFGVAADTFFVGDVNFGFDPYTLQFADGPRSVVDNNVRNAWERNTYGDSSRTYGAINTRAYAGFSNKSYGTLTYGRQYSFSTDNSTAYDPMGGAYAFSMIGFSGTLGGGLGATETARYNNSIKYLYNNNGIRAGVLSQVGGWDAGNNAQYAIQADLGFDYQGFSMDALYSYAKDAIALGVANGANPTLLASNLLNGTIQNIEGAQVAAKYKWDKFQIMGGWQIAHMTNPSDLPVGTAIRYANGYNDQMRYGTAIQTANAFPEARNLQTLWVGGKWAVAPTVDIAAAYYHAWQNDYLGNTRTATSCAPATTIVLSGAPRARVGTQSAKCAGSEDAISAMIDWKAYKRLDVYAGIMYSKVDGGLASNFFADNNVAVTSGIRFAF